MGKDGEIKILFRRRGISIAASMRRSQKRDQQQLPLKEVSDCFREIRCFWGLMIIYCALVVRERSLSTIKGMMAPNLRYHKWCLRHCANYVSSGHTSGAPSQHGQYRHLAEKTGDVEGTNPNKIPQPTQSQSRNLTRVAQVERCQYLTATNTDFGAK